jgi:hypothetical protein
VYWNPAILQLYLDGIQFATGDLEASTAPSSEASADVPPSKDDGEEGFQSLFNGRDLSGWTGDEKIWSVRDRAITGRTTANTGLKVNNFLLWKGGEPENFELRLKYKIVGGNSGVYFHAEKQPDGEPLIGPQADFSADGRWTGVLMEWKKRDILAERGQRVAIDESGKRQVQGSLGDPADLLKVVRKEDWNDYRVRVQGEKVTLALNGVTMCEVIDRDPRRAKKGHLALQVHVGPPMTVQFKDIRLKTLPE